MDFLAPGICIVALLLGLVSLVMARDVWRVHHLVLVFFVMVAGVASFYLAARTLQAQSEWGKEVSNFKKLIDEVDANNEKLKSSTDPAALGIAQLKEQLDRITTARGRVWYNAQRKIKPTPGGVLVVDTDGPEPPRIEPKTTLYVFESDEGNPNNEHSPGGRYLGEFQVASIKDNELELTPALKVGPEEVKRTSNAKTALTLYEAMPIDLPIGLSTSGGEAPANDNQAGAATGDKAAASARLGAETLVSLEPDRIKALFPKSVVDQYLSDGQPVQEKAGADEPSKPNKWSSVGTKVKFLKDFTVKDQLVQDGKGGKFELQPGADVAVAKDQVMLLDTATADKLAQSGVVEKLGRYRMRPLRNYASLFRDYFHRMTTLLNESDDAVGETKRIDTLTGQLDDATKIRDEQVAALKFDLDNFQREQLIVEKYLTSIQQRLDVVNKELATLFAANKQQAEELRQNQQRAMDAINKAIPLTKTDRQASREPQSIK